MNETYRVLGEYGYADEDDSRGLGWCDPQEETEVQADYLKSSLRGSDGQNGTSPNYVSLDEATENKNQNEDEDKDKIEAYADRLSCSYYEARLRLRSL